MNVKSPSTKRTEWTGYGTLMLLVVFVAAVAEALQVPQSLNEYFRSLRKDAEVISKQTSRTAESPIETSPVKRADVCSEWSSQNSTRRYSFVCVGADNFDVYEISDGQLKKIGSGSLNGDDINAQVVSLTKHRRGYWQLKLSSDKTTLEGTWRGDDPREFGNLKLHRVA